MAKIGLSVPPGFTITTEVCDAYLKADKKLPKGTRNKLLAHSLTHSLTHSYLLTHLLTYLLTHLCRNMGGGIKSIEDCRD